MELQCKLPAQTKVLGFGINKNGYYVINNLVGIKIMYKGIIRINWTFQTYITLCLSLVYIGLPRLNIVLLLD